MRKDQTVLALRDTFDGVCTDRTRMRDAVREDHSCDNLIVAHALLCVASISIEGCVGVASPPPDGEATAWIFCLISQPLTDVVMNQKITYNDTSLTRAEFFANRKYFPIVNENSTAALNFDVRSEFESLGS